MQLRALQAKTPPEKIKNKKGGHRMWEDIFDLGEKIRSGNYTWEDLQLDDVDVRLKWAGLFHRKKRAAGTFMMRLKVHPTHSGHSKTLEGASASARTAVALGSNGILDDVCVLMSRGPVH